MSSSAPACIACEQPLTEPPLIVSTFAYAKAGTDQQWQFSLSHCSACGMGRLVPTPAVEVLDALRVNGYGNGRVDWPHEVATAGGRLRWLLAGLEARALSSHNVGAQRALELVTDALEVAAGESVPLTASIPLSHSRHAMLLDFGCGAGSWLLAMRQRGYDNLAAFDVGQPALKNLSLHGIRCFADDVTKLPHGTFDCIRMQHALNYVADPVETLALLREKLAKRGTIVVTVPNFGGASARRFGHAWGALDLPHQLSHFTVHSLQRLSKRAGLQIRRTRFIARSQSATPRPKKGGLAKLRWQLEGHGYHARALNSPSAEYLSVEIEPR